MLKGLCAVADLIKLAYVLAALVAASGCSLAHADDYRPARPRKTEPVKVEPAVVEEPEPAKFVPITEPESAVEATEDAPPPEEPPAASLPPVQHESQTHSSREVSDPKPVGKMPIQTEVDLRPVVPFYTAPWCEPCKPIKARINGNSFPDFRFEERPPTPGMSIPQFGIMGSDGVEYAFMPTSFPVGRQRAELIAAWKRRNPGKPLRGIEKVLFPVPQVQPPMTAQAEFAQAAASTIPDQIRKFLGDEASIVITPSMPINTAMDDGSIVKYQKISAHYKMVSGVPMITLDQPQPQAFVRKFGIWFEADLQGARGNMDEHPPTATLKTSRGDVKIKIGLEPQ